MLETYMATDGKTTEEEKKRDEKMEKKISESLDDLREVHNLYISPTEWWTQKSFSRFY